MVCVYVCVSRERLWDCASTEAGRYATTCLGWSPPRQNHFPKVAVTHGAPNPAVYVTVAVKGIMAWHLWEGLEQLVRAEVNLLFSGWIIWVLGEAKNQQDYVLPLNFRQLHYFIFWLSQINEQHCILYIWRVAPNHHSCLLFWQNNIILTLLVTTSHCATGGNRDKTCGECVVESIRLAWYPVVASRLCRMMGPFQEDYWGFFTSFSRLGSTRFFPLFH